MLVLLGENNAGKSNLTRAVEILFGEQWPGTRRLEDHDFHGRDSDGIAVEVGAAVSGIACPYCSTGEASHFNWVFDPQNPADDGNPVTYRFTCSNEYCHRTFPKATMRSSLAASVLDADRRLSYQLSYASKYTMLSKLMHRFHQRLLADAQRKDRLSELFSNLLAEFGGVGEFAEFKRLLAETAEDFGQNLPYRLDVDFSAYDPSNFFRSLRIHPSLSGEVRSFDELGTGQSQVLALAFAYAYARAYGQSDGTILVIDEPEANLHPLAQQWLAARLGRLAAPGLQVVVTTHSPHFVDLSRPENLVMVSKRRDGTTQVVQRTRADFAAYLVERGADPTRTNPDTVGPFYAASATTELVSGLFARCVVVVEGPTEALALPELLRRRGLDVLREGVAVVSAEGIGNIAKWNRFYSALGIRCFCVFDTDSDKSAGQSTQLLAKRLDIASALGRDGDPAEAGVLLGEPLAVGSGYATFDPDFEGAMGALFGGDWSRLYAEATVTVGESKPLRARYAAQALPETVFDTDAAERLDALVRAIRGDQPGQAIGAGDANNWSSVEAASSPSVPPRQTTTPAEQGPSSLTPPTSAQPAPFPIFDWTAAPDPWAPPDASATSDPWATPPDASATPDPWATPPDASATPDPWATPPDASATPDPWATPKPEPATNPRAVPGDDADQDEGEQPPF
ncbi:AAA family ATPase [Nocardioides abyssi]|uniref:AAA family ATPase n=1 Tax=Nocardioides abyssi TaxID=3058370 RepID=A0ABT8EQK1_9ACTN|nr:AAA family ATPase [Nocardioides abyssi]MDN4160426.1 AAA family ATPase [Nocardioides abyssi]